LAVETPFFHVRADQNIATNDPLHENGKERKEVKKKRKEVEE
jgi:hypothetical protein